MLQPFYFPGAIDYSDPTFRESGITRQTLNEY